MPKWDLKSINSLRSAAEWIRKGSEARVVLVIRRQDIAVSVEPGQAPMETVTLIRNELPYLLDHLLKQGAPKQAANLDAEDPE
jgi:hypothetical protein